ncbi:MAG: hypothetical protein KF753_23070 [Caldilineaceae bacterium]|nr:hypothetical protein [Caldilineaceae bacterium]
MKKTTILRLSSKLLLLMVLLWPAFALASASRPLPPSGIHAIAPVPDDPAPSLSSLIPDTRVYNQLVYDQQNGANAASRELVETKAAPSSSGVLDERAVISKGGALFRTPTACLTFNDANLWNGQVTWAAYGNWGTFAVDDGGFYRPSNVNFSREAAVGDDYSFKIAGSQPYAAGLISPIIHAPPGAIVEVGLKYLMFDHEGLRVGDQIVNDWVSLGVKPDAHKEAARYVNGYSRGEWSRLNNSVVAGESGEVLVLIQAESPAPFNSNVYFDNVEIVVDGMALDRCE